MPEQTTINNILFDLGGVILDINVQATLKQFYELDFPAELLQYPHNMTTDLFYKYETGRIGTNEFRDEIRRVTGVDVSDKELDGAWNALKLDQASRNRARCNQSRRYCLYSQQ